MLGGLMLDNEKIVGISDRVKPDDFADALNGRIYTAMLRFAAKGMRADALTLRPLFANDSDARFGDYLDDLVASPAVRGAIDALADQVAELSARRAVRDRLTEAMDSIQDDLDVPIDAITGKVESAGWAAASRRPIEITYDPGEMVGLAEDRLYRIDEDSSAAGLRNKLLEEFDDGTGGIEKGTYNIIAGRPGMGKTLFASSLSLGYAIAGHAGHYLNHEMKAEQQAIRLSADIAHAMGFPIKHHDIKKGTLDGQQRAELKKVRQRGGLLPLRFIAPGRINVKRVFSLVSQQKALFAAQGRELDFVIVDYLGLLGADSADGRPLTKGYDRVQAVSLAMKTLANDLDVAVFALAQLSREVERRPNKRPQLSDLKESGDLEQDADSVTLLYREEYYLEAEKPKAGAKLPDKRDAFEEWEKDMFACRGKLDLIFAKNRHGRPATKTVKFLPEYSAVRSGGFNEMDVEESPLLI